MIGEASLLEVLAISITQGRFCETLWRPDDLSGESCCFIYRVKNGLAGIGRKGAIWLRLAIIFLMIAMGGVRCGRCVATSKFAHETLAPYEGFKRPLTRYSLYGVGVDLRMSELITVRFRTATSVF